MAVFSVGLLLLGAMSAALAQTASTTEPETQQPRLARISGKAYVDRHTKVTGAVVLIANEAAPSQLFMTSTDGGGQFVSTELPGGDYRVDVRRQGYQPVVKEHVSLTPPFRAVVELKMQPTPEISPTAVTSSGDGAATLSDVALKGLILDEENTALNQIRIRLVHPIGKADPLTVFSGAEGRFEATGLDPGPWQIEVTGVGFLPIVTTVELKRSSQLELKLVRQPPDYEPSPLELMTLEQPVTPAGLE